VTGSSFHRFRRFLLFLASHHHSHTRRRRLRRRLRSSRAVGAGPQGLRSPPPQASRQLRLPVPQHASLVHATNPIVAAFRNFWVAHLPRTLLWRQLDATMHFDPAAHDESSRVLDR